MARRRTKARKATYGGFLATIRRSRNGRKALSRFKRFWGVKHAPAIKSISLPGPKKKVVVLAGLGNVPEIELADGPKRRHRKTWKLKRPGLLTADASGRRMYILRSKPRRSRARFLGWVKTTNYIPNRGIEKAGSFKSNRYWRHFHHDDGGNWPKAWQTSRGDIVYEKGGHPSKSGKATYEIKKWIHR